MSAMEKIRQEVTAIALTTAYFAAWFTAILGIKALILAEYQIPFHRYSMAFVGALVAAKVVLVLERVPLGTWPAWIDVCIRTVLYGVGVVVVLLLEKAIEGRNEHGGVWPALRQVFHHADIHHVWATTIGIGGALLVFNALSALRGHVGDRALMRMLRTPVPRQERRSATEGG